MGQDASPTSPATQTITVTATAVPAITLPQTSTPASTATPTPTITHTPAPIAIAPQVVARLALMEDFSFQSGGAVLAATWDAAGDTLAISSGENIQWFTPPEQSNRSQVDVGVFTRALAFHPTRPDRLLSGSNDGLVRVWDLELAELVQELEANPKGINRLVISPDGNTLASAGNDALIYLWDLEGSNEQEPLIGGAFAVPDLVFITSVTGSYHLVSVDGGVIRVREVESSRLVISLRTGGPVQAIAVSPDARQVAAARQDGVIQMWSLESGELLWEQSLRPQDEPWSLVFDPAGELLFSGWRSGALCWLVSGQPDQHNCQSAHTRPLGVLAFHPEGHTLLTGGYDGWVYFWQIAR